MATAIIQANRSVRSFIKGSTGGHKGTYQVIGEKIRLGLGSSFDVEAVANAIERGGDGSVEASTSAATGSSVAVSAGDASSQSDWAWSAEHGQYYRVRSDRTYEWWAPSMTDGEWTWSPEHRRYYRRKADGTYEWQ